LSFGGGGRKTFHGLKTMAMIQKSDEGKGGERRKLRTSRSKDVRGGRKSEPGRCSSTLARSKKREPFSRLITKVVGAEGACWRRTRKGERVQEKKSLIGNRGREEKSSLQKIAEGCGWFPLMIFWREKKKSAKRKEALNRKRERKERKSSNNLRHLKRASWAKKEKRRQREGKTTVLLTPGKQKGDANSDRRGRRETQYIETSGK